VQQGIGFNQERGDSVKVVNAPFRVEAVPKPVEELPLWKQPWLHRPAAQRRRPGRRWPGGAVRRVRLIKPALKAALAPPPPPEPGSQLRRVVDDDAACPPPRKMPLKLLQAPNDNDRLEAARNLAKTNPAAVAHIVRGWVNGETA
jgi:flagellar M-ring protein FliF